MEGEEGDEPALLLQCEPFHHLFLGVGGKVVIQKQASICKWTRSLISSISSFSFPNNSPFPSQSSSSFFFSTLSFFFFFRMRLSVLSFSSPSPERVWDFSFLFPAFSVFSSFSFIVWCVGALLFAAGPRGSAERRGRFLVCKKREIQRLVPMYNAYLHYDANLTQWCLFLPPPERQ